MRPLPYNNPEVWASCPPASAEHVLKAIGAEFSASRKKALQQLYDRDAELVAQHESCCSPKAIEESKHREENALQDPSTTAQAAADVVLRERNFRDAGPIIEKKLNQERAQIRAQLFPACAELSRKLVAEIDAQLDNLPEPAVAARWAIPISGQFFDAIRHPLLRLKSMAEYDLTEVYGPLKVNFDPNLSPEHLLTSAGLISTRKS